MKLYPFPHYNQLKKNDCGPTCLKIISKHFGKTLEIKFIRDLCRLNTEGCSIWNLSQAGELLGLKSLIFDISFEQLVHKASLPCIAYLDNKHFVVIYKITTKYVYISDPATEKVKYLHGNFKLRFLSETNTYGTILCLEPQLKFYNTNGNGKPYENSFSYLKITLQYLKQYKIQLTQLTIILLLITILQGVTPFIFRSVLDIGVDKKNLDFIAIMFIANIVIILCTSFANILKDFITRHIGIRFGISIISNYLIQLLSRPLSFFSSQSRGEVLDKVKDHENIKSFILYHAINFTYSILTFFIFGLILLLFNRSVFLIFFFITILYIIWILSFKKIQENIEKGAHYLYSKNNNFWIETIDNIIDIKSNNYEYNHRKKWEEIQVMIYHYDISSAKNKNLQDAGANIINGLRNIIVTFFCANAVVNGEMTFGVFISIQFMVGFLNSPISYFINFIQSYPSAKQSFSRLNDIHISGLDKDNSDGYKFEINEDFRNILFQKTYFQYSPNSEYALKNINISIPYGKTTAIIGKSGCGKSSIIKLMLGLYEHTNGEIAIDNLQFRNLNIAQWRNQCGVVLQDSKIFNDTILNNIVLTHEGIDYNKVDKVAKIVDLIEVIQGLPHGYNTKIGEKGRMLSQGQKQRILLARALYKEPKCLFLDEATSGLDIITESIIMKRISIHMKNKMLVIATHRINMIEEADQIIVMHDGMIMEYGTHEILIKKNGLYSKMNLLQATTKVETKP